jgi:hypothetical protein
MQSAAFQPQPRLVGVAAGGVDLCLQIVLVLLAAGCGGCRGVNPVALQVAWRQCC